MPNHAPKNRIKPQKRRLKTSEAIFAITNETVWFEIKKVSRPI